MIVTQDSTKVLWCQHCHSVGCSCTTKYALFCFSVHLEKYLFDFFLLWPFWGGWWMGQKFSNFIIQLENNN